MSKKKSPSIPEAPSFQTDPNVAWSQDVLKSQVPNLLSLSGLPAPLMEAINTNPQITQLTLQGLQAQLDPVYRQRRQDTINTLEANNQLTGSTTASSLGNLESDYMAQLTAAGAEAGINDINRALQNRVNLYGTGLNMAAGVGSTGLNNQNQMNQFALQNYENQVAAALLSQPQQSGGWAGGLTGGLGGAGTGAMIGTMIMPGIGTAIGAGIGAGIGGFAGSQAPSGTGGQFLGAGASMFGNRNSTPFQTSGGGETIYKPLYQPTTNSAINYFGGFGLN